jgi:hypothetical protein
MTSAPDKAGGSGGGGVPITSLNMQELTRVREQLQGDMEHLLESHTMLGRLAARSEAAAKAVDTLAASKPGALAWARGAGREWRWRRGL